MDEQLRKLQRQTALDPEAKDRYIGLLERLAFDNFPSCRRGNSGLKFWLVQRSMKENSPDYIIGLYLTKKLAQKAACDYALATVRDNIDEVYLPDGVDLASLEKTFAEYTALYDAENYSTLIERYLDGWSHHGEDIEIGELELSYE